MIHIFAIFAIKRRTMYYKCALLVGGVAYDATEDLRNWDEVKTTIERKDYGGAVRSFTSAFTFVGDSYARILQEYRTNGLEASLGVVFYTRTNSWGWKEEFAKTLDVSTLKYTAWDVSLNAVDDSIEAIIKAKKGTQYECSLENYREDTDLRYDGIEMENSVTWDISGETQDDGSVTIDYGQHIAQILCYIPLFVMNEDYTANRYVVFNDSGWGECPTNASEADCVIRATGSVTVWPELKMSAKVSGNAAMRKLCIGRCKGNTYEGIREIALNGNYTDIDISDIGVGLEDGDGLIVFIRYSGSEAFTLTIKPGASFKVNWKSRREPVMLPVVKPVTLLNCLLKSMNGGKDGLTGRIDFTDTRGTECLLLPAEGIRGISGGKMYSSFQQFCDWMSAVFGMVYYVDGDTVAFVKRGTLYDTEVVKRLDDTSDFSYSVTSSLIYSQVNAGYDKQDYDSVNGRYEFNFATYYETGVTLTENKLELMSPYRADGYGVEFLVDTRGAESTDTDSDSDMFFTQAAIQGGRYVLRRDKEVTGAPAGVFNAAYSPRSCVLANEDFIGVSVKKLTYASATGNSDVVIDGVAEKSDVTIGKQLFTPGVIQVSSSDLNLPDNWNGLVELEQGGVTYRGYLSSVDKTYTREESTTYELMEHKGE